MVLLFFFVIFEAFMSMQIAVLGGKLCHIRVNTNISQTEWASKVLDFNCILYVADFQRIF